MSSLRIQHHLARAFGDNSAGRREYGRLLQRDGISPLRPRHDGLLWGGLPRMRDGAIAQVTMPPLAPRAEDDTDMTPVEELGEGVIGKFGGYGSVYGSQNSFDEIFEQGAWEQTIVEDWARLRSLWQHDRHLPLGLPIEGETRSDDVGLYWSSNVMDFAWAADPMKALRWRIVTGLSVGFWIVEYKINLEGNELSHGWPIIHVIRARLAEVSPVTWGSDPVAEIDMVRDPASDEWTAPATDAPAPPAAPLPDLSRATAGADEILRLIRQRAA